MQKNTSSTYRYDIDGLRAVAVLLVTIFHINPALIPGGFIGVDLFFVISGFVITQGILKNGLSTEKDFLEFYRRRIRRITPVMLFVTTATLLAGVFIITPPDLMSLATSAIFAAFSLANVYFTYFLDTSYFAQGSHTVPLLHLWSLGVEEQFYLIWPFLLFFLMKRRRLLLPSLAVIIIVSIAIGEYQVRTGRISVAYYMLPARVFQMATGGLCCVLVQQKVLPHLPRLVATLISALGLALIAGSAAFLSGISPFPGLHAIPVTLGGAMLLLAGLNENPFATVLASRPFRHFGNISYSLYLWHWPILAYLRYMYVDIKWLTGALSFVVMWGLAIFSTRFIEARYRHSNQHFSDIFKRHFVYPSIALAALCGAIIANKGFVPFVDPEDYESQMTSLAQTRKPLIEYKNNCINWAFTEEDSKRPECLINKGASNTNTFLLWGDSNASHYVGMMSKIAFAFDFSFRNASNSACPPILNHPERYASVGYKEGCEKASPIFRRLIDRSDTVFIGADWKSYSQYLGFWDDMLKTVAKLSAEGKHIVMISQIPWMNYYDASCHLREIKLPLIDCNNRFKNSTPNDRDILELKKIASTIPNVFVININDLLCYGGVCSSLINNDIIYFNSTHLSTEGSELLGDKFLSSPQSIDLRRFIGDPS